MGLILQPSNSFTVVRQIANHLDQATYYVQAVIRNAYTDEIISTLNLEDKGSQRFKKNWQVPADSSGQGFYVSIVTSVYTDSNYTTKSENYGDEEDTYLVSDHLGKNRSAGMVVGAGSGIDGYDVRRIFKEEFAQIAKTLEKDTEEEEPEAPMRWDEILRAIQELKTALKPKETKPADLSPVLNALKASEGKIVKMIENKEVTPVTDLSEVNEGMATLNEDMSSVHDSLKEVIEDTEAKIKDAVIAGVKKIFDETSIISSTVTFFDGKVPAMHRKQEEHKEEPKKKRLDIDKLTK